MIYLLLLGLLIITATGTNHGNVGIETHDTWTYNLNVSGDTNITGNISCSNALNHDVSGGFIASGTIHANGNKINFTNTLNKNKINLLGTNNYGFGIATKTLQDSSQGNCSFYNNSNNSNTFNVNSLGNISCTGTIPTPGNIVCSSINCASNVSCSSISYNSIHLIVLKLFKYLMI